MIECTLYTAVLTGNQSESQSYTVGNICWLWLCKWVSGGWTTAKIVQLTQVLQSGNMRQYYQRFWLFLWKGFAVSTGEQVIGALLVIGILVCQIGLALSRRERFASTSSRWRGPMCACLDGFSCGISLGTPYELDQEQQQRGREDLESDVAMLITKVAANYDGRPLFVLVIMGTPGQRQEDGKYSIHWVLRLENHGVRTARYVRPRQVLSRMERF